VLGRDARGQAVFDYVVEISRAVGLTTGTAGGTTMACTLKLIQNGSIPRDESIVVCVTGNGYKTAEVMQSRVKAPVQMGRALKEFDDFMEQAGRAPVAQP
jgi:threonine synthase